MHRRRITCTRCVWQFSPFRENARRILEIPISRIPLAERRSTGSDLDARQVFSLSERNLCFEAADYPRKCQRSYFVIYQHYSSLEIYCNLRKRWINIARFSKKTVDRVPSSQRELHGRKSNRTKRTASFRVINDTRYVYRDC